MYLQFTNITYLQVSDVEEHTRSWKRNSKSLLIQEVFILKVNILAHNITQFIFLLENCCKKKTILNPTPTFKKHIMVGWEAMYLFFYCKQNEDLKLSRRQIPIFVLYKFHVQWIMQDK